MSRRCQSRHRKCWIIGHSWLWCYECGAVRPNTAASHSRWIYPGGVDAHNPACVCFCGRSWLRGIKHSPHRCEESRDRA